MLKRLNVFVLVVFLLSQTIIGPISSTVGFVSAAGDDHGEGANEIDKTALTELLEKVEKENYEEENYEADSFKSFVEAITAGKEVVENADASEEDVKEAVSEIEKTIDALQKATSPKEEESDVDTEEDNEGKSSGNKEKATQTEAKSTADKKSKKVAKSAENEIQPLVEEHENYEEEILLENSHVKGFVFKVNGKEFTEGGTIEGVSNEDIFELKIDLVDPLPFEELNY